MDVELPHGQSTDEATPLLTPDQIEELSVIKEVLESTTVEGVEVRSGFVANHCGCQDRDNYCTLYKTIIQGLPEEAYVKGGGFFGIPDLGYCPGHIHKPMPRGNHRCSLEPGECRLTHRLVVEWVRQFLNGYMRIRSGIAEHPAMGTVGHLGKKPQRRGPDGRWIKARVPREIR